MENKRINVTRSSMPTYEEYCEEIKSIIIPKAVTTIGSKAFYMCTKLTSITFNGTMEELKQYMVK